MTALVLALLLDQIAPKMGPTGFSCPTGYAIQLITGTRDKGRCVAVGGATGSGLPSDPAACPGGQFVTDQNASGTLTCSAPPAQDWTVITSKPSTFTPTTHTHAGGDVTSSVATATALAANGSDCSAGQAAAGVDASGAATGCFVPAGTYSLPDAAAAVKGGVQLAGDLAGTAASPSVVDDSHAHTSTTVSGLDAGDVTTGTFAASQIPAATSSTLGGVIVPACSPGFHYSSASAGTLQCTADAGGGGGGMALPYVIAATAFGGF